MNGELCQTFRGACETLGLPGDDKEWTFTFEEASNWATASELRSLFTHMLLYCEISDPILLWNEQWHKMADDGQRNFGITNDDELRQFVLYELELLLRSGSSPSSLSEYDLPLPNSELLQRLHNRLLMEEKNYDRHLLASEQEFCRSRLNCQQQIIYEHVMSTISSNQQVFAFVYEHRGTRKTFLWTTIISGLRSRGNIVLAVAASGIASLLFPSGRTAHSRFKIPIDITDNTTCNINKKTHLAQLLAETSIVIWDEAPMNDRKCFESLDRSMKDLFDNIHQPFGGKSILLGGDFRQTLPVIPKSSKSTILASSLPRSYLWKYFKLYKLNENMCL